MKDHKKPAPRGHPEVRVKPHTYQPNKADLEAPMKIDATPDELARAALRPVKVTQADDA